MIEHHDIHDGAGQVIWHRIWDALTDYRRWAVYQKLLARSVVIDRGYKSPCFEWTGPTSGSGRGGSYGRMNLDGATVATHIAGWTNFNGLIPPRKQLDHKCENRRCWREDHLELVTHKQNQKRKTIRKNLRPDSDTQWTPEQLHAISGADWENMETSRDPN